MHVYVYVCIYIYIHPETQQVDSTPRFFWFLGPSSLILKAW